MNSLTMSDDEIMAIVNPIMDNLMQASTDIDHEKHIRDFSENMKEIVTKDNLEKQCLEYQKSLGFLKQRELIGIIRKKNDVRVFWRQWYSKSEDEYLAFIHIMRRNSKYEVVNVSIS